MNTTSSPQELPLLPDAITHAPLSRLTRGIAPLSVIGAYMDWATHLASSPGKQSELAQSALSEWNEWCRYVQSASMGDCDLCVSAHPRDETMQQFWSGKSYLRPDDGNLLSYDLAQRLIALIGQDHERLTRFVHQASSQDGGSQAALEVLGTTLGELTEEAIGAHFVAPDAGKWNHEVEKGWF